jgi:hypothetical protein
MKKTHFTGSNILAIIMQGEIMCLYMNYSVNIAC